jgi:hypothetical protein
LFAQQRRRLAFGHLNQNSNHEQPNETKRSKQNKKKTLFDTRVVAAVTLVAVVLPPNGSWERIVIKQHLVGNSGTNSERCTARTAASEFQNAKRERNKTQNFSDFDQTMTR